MARKKRKAGKRPAASFHPVARRDAVAPWLGALVFCASYFAMLGGVSDGTLDWRRIFDFDTLRSYLIYADLFLSDDYPMSGWLFRSENPHWFPEALFAFAALALGGDVRIALYLLPLFWVGMAAWGWMKVCDLLYGKSPARRCVVWLLHALAFLVLAWRGMDVLKMHLMGFWHYGVWSVLPWLMLLSLRMLDDKFSPRKGWGATAGLLVLLFLITASDLITVTWFTMPAALTALLTTRLSAPAARGRLLLFLAVLAAATGLDFLVPEPLPKLSSTTGGFSMRASAEALRRMAGHLQALASDNPPEAAVWLAFAGISAWRTLRVFPRLELFRGERREPPPSAHPLHALFGVPPTREHRFVAVFVSASAAASFSAVIYSANVGNDPGVFAGIERLRHCLPLVYFPLFVGWALLPWRFRNPPSMRPLFFAAAFALALSVAKATAMDWKKMDPFGTPFQQCFVENAARLGWRQGVGISYYIAPATDPRLKGKTRLAPVWIGRFHDGRGGIIHRITPHAENINKNYWTGDIQFVAVNMFNERVWSRPPRAGDLGCAPRHPDYLECMYSMETSLNVVMDESAARQVFGEPAEVVDCGAGGAFFHYDPPLHFNPPERLEDFRRWVVAPAQ